MLSFSHQAQLADLGLSIAYSCANVAMSNAFAAFSLALTMPLAIAAAARSPLGTAMTKPAPASYRALAATAAPVVFSSYRSDGGHASTHVTMGQLAP